MAAQNRPHLEFLKNEADEAEGLGHAGIETFRDAPYASLGREHGQNSLDARASDPVRVKFDLIRIPASDFPDRAVLLAAVMECLRQARDEKTRAFFREAKKVLEANTVKVLRIADFNTRGLRGPSEPGTPFHALLKGAGVSEDKAETSGGSFGIGKNAAFAASDLQTVFYSTIFSDKSGNPGFLAQGKSVLVSHKDVSGTLRKATGYWGSDGFSPVSDQSLVPGWLRREKTGTSVYVIGFREKENWASRVAAALLQNFFGAVHNGKLEFLVNEEQFRINAQTLGALFTDPGIRKNAEMEGRLEDLEFAAAMYRCLVSGEAIERELQTPELGRTTVRVMMEDGLPKRVLLLRNGMWITDSLQHFGEKFQRFPMYRDFVAVVECHDVRGNALLKQLESPRHDSLSAERVPDAANREKSGRIMRTLARQIREAIRACAKPEPGTIVAIDELAEFFADSTNNDRPPAPGGDLNPEKLTYKSVQRRKVSAAGGDGRGQTGGGGGGKGRKSGNKGGFGDKDGPGAGGSGHRGERQGIPLADLRNVLAARGDATRRLIYLTPERSGMANIEILASGIESSSSLKLAGTDQGAVSGHCIQLELQKGKRIKLSVAFEAPYDGPIEVTATSLQGEEGQ